MFIFLVKNVIKLLNRRHKKKATTLLLGRCGDCEEKRWWLVYVRGDNCVFLDAPPDPAQCKIIVSTDQDRNPRK